MKYFLDCEFNGFGGALLSLALAAEDGRTFYVIMDRSGIDLDPWVMENVIPHMMSVPAGTRVLGAPTPAAAAHAVKAFFADDGCPHIICDWPDDIAYFCRALMTGPGEMVSIRHMTFEMLRGVPAYPTTLPGAVQHNALWDALAMKHLFT